MPNVAVIITTFLRDNLLYKCLQSIVNNYTPNLKVFVADQGYNDDEKNITIDYYKSQLDLEYFKIPFDSGLSYGRNFLVQKAVDYNIPYCLIIADSIHFSQSYDFSSFIDFLESDKSYGLIGFELLNSKCAWEFLLKIENRTLYYLPANNYIIHNQIQYKKVDICRNCFLAKTKAVLNLWDNEMKLSEHTVSFIELQKRNYKVFWTDTISFQRNSPRPSKEYESYRKRTQEYRKLAMLKMDITKKVMSK